MRRCLLHLRLAVALLLLSSVHSSVLRAPAAHSRSVAAGRKVAKGLEPLGWLSRLLTGLQDAALSPLIRMLEASQRRRAIRRLPKRIILVRHGQSEGNVDKTLYAHVPDSAIPLTATGFEQGMECGRQLRKLLPRGGVHFYYSPYMRTRQTLRGVLKSFEGSSRRVLVSCEPRIRECDFGNFQNASHMDEILAERQRFGRFYFRFPNGEAGTDVFDRVKVFLFHLWNESPNHEETVVLVTHGLLMRTVCMSYFGWTPSEFEQVWNPSNCEMWVLELNRRGEYRLAGRIDGADSHEGAPAELESIRFGVNQSEELPEHMKQPASSRWMEPCASEAYESLLFAHLRVPGPRTQAALRREDAARLYHQ